jgi:hypothetical protein
MRYVLNMLTWVHRCNKVFKILFLPYIRCTYFSGTRMVNCSALLIVSISPLFVLQAEIKYDGQYGSCIGR